MSPPVFSNLYHHPAAEEQEEKRIGFRGDAYCCACSYRIIYMEQVSKRENLDKEMVMRDVRAEREGPTSVPHVVRGNIQGEKSMHAP